MACDTAKALVIGQQNRYPMRMRIPFFSAVLLLLISSAIADTPDSILADYLEEAKPAVARVDSILDKAVAPILADLVKGGDTQTADQILLQLKAQRAGEPVLNPPAQVAALFHSYNKAKMQALLPARKRAIARIEAMLRGSSGGDLKRIEELKRVRAEIETDTLAPNQLPSEWNYLTSLDARSTAWFKLGENGVLEWHDPTGTKTGKWQPTRSGFELEFLGETWKATVQGDTATIERPRLGTRFAKVRS